MGESKRNLCTIVLIGLAAALIGLLGLFIASRFFTIQRQAIPRWSIGRYWFDNQFNLIYDYPNPVFSVDDLRGRVSEFVADPFVFAWGDSLYLFYERGLNVASGGGWTGVIGLATSKDGLDWNDRGVVLHDSAIVSFPVIYEYADDIYMTVEGAGANNVRLFKASSFPNSWTCVDTLLTGQWSDPVVHEHKGVYYLFTSKPKYHDLHLFYSSSFLGPYTEHPESPVVKSDKARGRNAGVLFEISNALYRPVQDCSRMYGEQVKMMEVKELSITGYSEKETDRSPILAGSGKGWNKLKMHTFNVFHQDSEGFAVITDGSPVNYEYRIRILKRGG
ncbi:MAG: hypothetical protein PHG32_06850 [Candidatus Cloacimonetes bacterium]|nr:hypothetical protein [Candidatus Cloacimonadota bacterium]